MARKPRRTIESVMADARRAFEQRGLDIPKEAVAFAHATALDVASLKRHVQGKGGYTETSAQTRERCVAEDLGSGSVDSAVGEVCRYGPPILIRQGGKLDGEPVGVYRRLITNYTEELMKRELAELTEDWEPSAGERMGRAWALDVATFEDLIRFSIYNDDEFDEGDLTIAVMERITNTRRPSYVFAAEFWAGAMSALGAMLLEPSKAN